MNLPRSGQIRKSFKATIREIKLALKEINGRAAKCMARGDYPGAQAMMDQAKQVQEFAEEVRRFQKRLGQFRGGPGGEKPAKNDTHAQWEFYQPILQCLIDLDTDATRDQIESRFGERFDSWLRPGDRASMSRGRPRWKIMIGRSRKHLIEEGFVEAPNHLIWRVTENGRKAAEQDTGVFQES